MITWPQQVTLQSSSDRRFLLWKMLFGEVHFDINVTLAYYSSSTMEFLFNFPDYSLTYHRKKAMRQRKGRDCTSPLDPPPPSPPPPLLKPHCYNRRLLEPIVSWDCWRVQGRPGSVMDTHTWPIVESVSSINTNTQIHTHGLVYDSHNLGRVRGNPSLFLSWIYLTRHSANPTGEIRSDRIQLWELCESQVYPNGSNQQIWTLTHFHLQAQSMLLKNNEFLMLNKYHNVEYH